MDALGDPVSFFLKPRQACDLDGADVLLLPNVEAEAMLGDKGYDAEERVIKILDARGIVPGIPSKSNRKEPRPYQYLCQNKSLQKFWQNSQNYPHIDV